jgi:hypothetical protein
MVKLNFAIGLSPTIGSERASGEGDTENLPTVGAKADIMPFD